MSREIRQNAARFFDEFVEAFKTFDGAVIAERYFVPFVAVHTDGTAETMQSRSEIANYFQRYLDSYYADGCRTCGYEDLEVTGVGETCMLATVTWLLFDDNQAVVTSWRESYNIISLASEMLVLSSVDHVD